MHPDLYQQLRTAVLLEAAQLGPRLTTQTAVYLDLLFEADGLAGAAFSFRAADYMQEAREQELRMPPPAFGATNQNAAGRRAGG